MNIGNLAQLTTSASHIDDAVLRAAQSGDWDQVKMIESEIGEVSSLIDAYGWDWIDLALCDTAAALIQARNQRGTWNSLQSLVELTYHFDDSLGPRGNLQSAMETNDFKYASSVLDLLDEMENVTGPTSKALQQLSDILGSVASSMAVLENEMGLDIDK
ncbi:hypothetical protein L198_05909 [Cryptococcus wingfieldii CBS 7118]|uniref:Uncharacterized protein n=1 Tax=Cryptococcus wingfieldii CBS 7118 TaxID=1295528 RepID=A0A1E3ISG6_9TREE|nr:hypothetical protein L198_05909 [Cryptococcus wingfieldii CBS 7118]ODN91395.1 hypothetical protein L198_05909 [Cryptococcus wingfieldii CBS 7118]